MYRICVYESFNLNTITAETRRRRGVFSASLRLRSKMYLYSLHCTLSKKQTYYPVHPFILSIKVLYWLFILYFL